MVIMWLFARFTYIDKQSITKWKLETIQMSARLIDWSIYVLRLKYRQSSMWSYCVFYIFEQNQTGSRMIRNQIGVCNCSRAPCLSLLNFRKSSASCFVYFRYDTNKGMEFFFKPKHLEIYVCAYCIAARKFAAAAENESARERTRVRYGRECTWVPTNERNSLELVASEQIEMRACCMQPDVD